MESATSAVPGPVEPWRVRHAHLINLAYRMLSDVRDAEDAVQEAYARMAAIGPEALEDAGGWLAVVTTRLCLDQLRSARHRYEQPEDPNLLHDAAPLGTTATPDPADRITLDDQVRRALADVLDRLGPAERVAFILHDVFRTPFDDIADVLGRSPTTCRQLASRARRRISDGPPASDPVSRTDHEAITTAFIDACARGSLPLLVDLLTHDAWGVAQLGPGQPPVTNHDPKLVATTLLRYWQAATLVAEPGADRPTILAFVDRRPAATITLDPHEGRTQTVAVTVLTGAA